MAGVSWEKTFGGHRIEVRFPSPPCVDPGYLSAGGNAGPWAVGDTDPWPGSAGRSALPCSHARPPGPSARPYEGGSSPRVPGRTWAGRCPRVPPLWVQDAPGPSHLSRSRSFHVLERVRALCAWPKCGYNHGLYDHLPARPWGRPGPRCGAAPPWGTLQGSIPAAACPHSYPDTLLCTQLPLPEVALTTAPLDRRPLCLLPYPTPPARPSAPWPPCPPHLPSQLGSSPPGAPPTPSHPSPLQTVWSLCVHNAPAVSCPLLSPSPRVLRPVPLGTLPGRSLACCSPTTCVPRSPRRRPVPAASQPPPTGWAPLLVPRGAHVCGHT